MNKNDINILIVEDESLLALEFASSIREYGYNVVDYVTSSQDATSIMTQNRIDLLLMDINIKEDIDGIELYNLLKTDAFVIYLTAYKDDATISKAIETEPLGYLTKPLNYNELKALLQLAEVKIAKKQKYSSDLVKVSKNYSFDLRTQTLYYKEQYVKLSIKKLELLKLLIEANKQVVSFSTLEDALWKDFSPSESALRTLIYRLRSDLKEDIIENELNFGIRLKKFM